MSNIGSWLQGVAGLKAAHASRRISRLLLRNEVLMGGSTALGIKSVGSVLNFIMFALCARHMDPGSFGALAVIYNAMSFLAVLAMCGQQTMIVRSWDEYMGSDRPGYARGALAFSLKIIFAAGAITVTVISLAWEIWDPNVAPQLLIAACAFLFAQGLMHFSAQFSRVAAGIMVAELPRETLWRLIVIGAIGLYSLQNTNLSAADFLTVCAVALFAAVALQTCFIIRAIPASVRQAKAMTEVPLWISRSSRMWASAVLDVTSQYLEIVMISLVLGPTAAAFCFVATRITAVFPMIAGGITGYAMSRISRLFYAGAKEELRGILQYLAVMSVLLTGAALLAIAAAGKLLLATFGEVYVDVFPALILLALGTAATALTGPAPYLLLLTGNEGNYLRIMAWGLVVRSALIGVLGYSFGLMGAVVALSVSNILTSLALVMACRRMVDLDPSLLSTVWPWSSPVQALRRSGS